MSEEYIPDKPIWKSFVFFNDKCFFVSTIERTYDLYGGSSRGLETIVWEYNWDKSERGEMLHQSGGVVDHQEICRSIIATGNFPKERE